MIFLIMLPFGVIAWILGWLGLEKSSAMVQKPAFNGIGMIGVVFGSLSLLMVFSHLHQWGIFSISSIVCLLVGDRISSSFLLEGTSNERTIIGTAPF